MQPWLGPAPCHTAGRDDHLAQEELGPHRLNHHRRKRTATGKGAVYFVNSVKAGLLIDKKK